MFPLKAHEGPCLPDSTCCHIQVGLGSGSDLIPCRGCGTKFLSVHGPGLAYAHGCLCSCSPSDRIPSDHAIVLKLPASPAPGDSWKIA